MPMVPTRQMHIVELLKMSYLNLELHLGLMIKDTLLFGQFKVKSILLIEYSL